MRFFLSKKAQSRPMDMQRRRLAWPAPGLGVKMAALAIAGTLLFIISFGYLATTALNESTQANLNERVVLAQNTARHVDYVISSIESVLTNPEARACWLTWDQAVSSVDCAYHRLSFFASEAILVDETGSVVAAYPPITTAVSFADYASVQAVLGGQAFAVSRYRRAFDAQKRSALAVAPVFDDTGRQRGALVIAIDLTSPGIRTFSNPIDLGATGYMDLVDMGGNVLTSTRPERIGQLSDHEQALTGLIQTHHQTVSTCHGCHDSPFPSTSPPTREILAFAPLDRAPWGVAVRQSEDEVLASTRQMQQRILFLLSIAAASALLLIFWSTRSILRPIQVLTAATQRIAHGDLATPIPSEGKDEIGILARSFDEMRGRLQNSMDEIRTWNKELDARVQEQTAQCKSAAQEIGFLYVELQEKERIRRELLHRILSVQEDERKRISRELHDDTCQVLLTLAMGLENIGEMVAERTPPNLVLPQLEALRSLAKTGRDGVNRLIFDLRPMMLDHLGLLSALRWYADVRLGDSNVRFTIQEIGTMGRLPPVLETTLFRVGQEAINNIAQHSKARHADLILQSSDGMVTMSISDDGAGFTPAAANTTDQQGLGLVGMEERILGVGGEFQIQSTPGAGTRIRISVPRNGNSSHVKGELKDGQNSCLDCG